MVFYDIDDKKIKRLVTEVVDKLSLPPGPSIENAFLDVVECISEIKLRTWVEWESELKEDIKECKEHLKCWREARKQGDKDALQQIKEINYDIKTSKHFLEQIPDEKKAIGQACAFPDKTEKNDYPSYTILLIKDNIEKLSDDQIRLAIGHEFVHVYLNVVNRRNLYEIDDREFCNFIAEEWFGIKPKSKDK